MRPPLAHLMVRRPSAQLRRADGHRRLYLVGRVRNGDWAHLDYHSSRSRAYVSLDLCRSQIRSQILPVLNAWAARPQDSSRERFLVQLGLLRYETVCPSPYRCYR